MRVRQGFNVEMEVKNSGIEFEPYRNGKQNLGDLVLDEDEV